MGVYCHAKNIQIEILSLYPLDSIQWILFIRWHLMELIRRRLRRSKLLRVMCVRCGLV